MERGSGICWGLRVYFLLEKGVLKFFMLENGVLKFFCSHSFTNFLKKHIFYVKQVKFMVLANYLGMLKFVYGQGVVKICCVLFGVVTFFTPS